MAHVLTEKAEQFFRSRLGRSLDDLLKPIDPDHPTGRAVRDNGVYSAIREARREDDPTLPMGAWAHELKQADWDKVTDIAAHVLSEKSKDLQVAAWLLEAQLNKAGFEAITPCVLLMQSLCERYWETLYPRMDHGEEEYRANVLRWVNEKLLPQIRLLPLTAAGRAPREWAWADFEQAQRNEQIKAQARGRQIQVELEGATMAEVQAALSATPTEAHAARHRQIADALSAIESFTTTLDARWGEGAPSLRTLSGLLEQIQALLAAELYKRGVRMAPAADKDDAAESQGPSRSGGGNEGDAGGNNGGGGNVGPIRDRNDAYQRLAEVAEYLLHREPHSPVPYLLRRAVEWGAMNTSELYREIFMRCGSNLNVFEMLGIEPDKRGD